MIPRKNFLTDENYVIETNPLSTKIALVIFFQVLLGEEKGAVKMVGQKDENEEVLLEKALLDKEVIPVEETGKALMD